MCEISEKLTLFEDIMEFIDFIELNLRSEYGRVLMQCWIGLVVHKLKLKNRKVGE